MSLWIGLELLKSGAEAKIRVEYLSTQAVTGSGGITRNTIAK